jgi:hypothetical protein
MEDLEAEASEEDENDEAKPAAMGRNFVELPEGYLTLVGFSHLLEKKRPEGRHVKVRSQVLYSTAKNTKTFPVETHVDGRQIINVKKGLEWWDAKEARQAERKALADASAADISIDDAE